MLILDGHASHISTAAIEFCIRQKIILLCLPAHTTHILQPLDVGVFGPLGKLHNIVAYICLSPQRKQRFKLLSSDLLPHRDNKTRWNSWYNMLD